MYADWVLKQHVLCVNSEKMQVKLCETRTDQKNGRGFGLDDCDTRKETT